jgi:nuclear autoantigenic sperm protein
VTREDSSLPILCRQVTEIAMNLLVQGRRHLLVSDIPSAIAALAESVQLLVEQYGEFADECAESYYYYGMALLEMARTDCDVLGDAVEGGDLFYFI